MWNVFADQRDHRQYAEQAVPIGATYLIPLTRDDVYRDDIAIDRAVAAVMNVATNGPDELVTPAYGFRN